METQREFRDDYSPVDKSFKFTRGEKAIVLEIRKPDIEISVRDKSYTLPYRDFIILTKHTDFNSIPPL